MMRGGTTVGMFDDVVFELDKGLDGHGVACR